MGMYNRAKKVLRRRNWNNIDWLVSSYQNKSSVQAGSDIVCMFRSAGYHFTCLSKPEQLFIREVKFKKVV